MENSTVNPVSETEMRSFFDRIATGFVSLSEQAKALAELRPEVDQIRRELDQLRAERESLRDQIDTLVSERDTARREVVEAHDTARAERERYANSEADLAATAESYARDLEVAKDRIRTLEVANDQSRKAVQDAETTVTDLRRKVEDMGYAAANSQRSIDSMTGEVEYWRSRAKDFEGKVTQIRSVLEAVKIAA